MNKIINTIMLFMLCVMTSVAVANTESPVIKSLEESIEELPKADASQSTVIKRTHQEELADNNRFVIAFYKPNYVLPFYYTGSPYSSIYRDNIPNDGKIKKTEFKFQLSFKFPIIRDIADYPSSLYFGYTQLSYWQLYTRDPFFRETDYQPEFYLANQVDRLLPFNWVLNFVNFGINHQSNGFGGNLERTWNRIYMELVLSRYGFMLSMQPWYVIKDSSYDRHNPNLTNYLGYGLVTMAYRCHKHVFALQLRNLTGGKRITSEFTWSYPLTGYMNLYFQAFSGYGQSLIEYNHHTNSVGLGIAFSDYL